MKLKLISSLEKCFLDEDINSKAEYAEGSCFKNEIFRFGCCYILEEICNAKQTALISVNSPLKEYVTVRRVEHVPVQLPVLRLANDDDYLRKTPGLYPDLLIPVEKSSRVVLTNNLQSLFIEVDTKGEAKAGVYPIEIVFKCPETDEIINKCCFTLEIIDANLPEQELKFTQWFYCDCLMDYYRTEAFSEEHWRIIENFMKTAVRNGINMILTPVFTPALDTYVGGERPTVQLVDVKCCDGKYSFGFDKLGRWIDISKKCGIKYFEIAHFFTQWGAKNAPKVMAEKDGEIKKIFGWETEASGKEYSEFLSCLIPALVDYLKSKGVDKDTVYHISDEPFLEHLEDYKKARAVVEPLLQGYTIMDALSNYEFYEKGIVTSPVPSTGHIEPFLENNVPDLWTYYCMGPAVEASNRFISMPSHRNRIIGTQFYKYNIKGFLHWGYNFYNNQYSYSPINPFLITDGQYFAPAGDPFSVYPAPDGTAYESLRICVFYDAIQDMRALQLCESFYGKEYTVSLMEEGIEPITFKNYPRNTDYLLKLREKVNKAIKNKLS